MKKTAFSALLIIAVVLTGCKAQVKPKKKAPSSDEPVAKVEQKIKTPVLGEKLAKLKRPDEVEKKLAAPPKKPVPPKEIIPGMPLQTPPIPPQVSKPVSKPTSKPGPAEQEKPLASLPAVAPIEMPKPATAKAEEVTFQPKIIAGATNIDVVLDASGSMKALFGPAGQTKIDIVRRALEDVMLAASQQKNVPRNIGLRVFGADKPIETNDCQDTSSIAPMGPIDIGAIAKATSVLTPQGTSPIAVALNKAAKDFPSGMTGDRVIVLIADGSDSCGGDPCRVAQQLHDGPDKIIFQVVGFDISPDDHEKLKCIASKGGGTFYLARNEAELRGAIDDAINSLVPYNLRLTITSGVAPLSGNITILESNTSNVVSKERSFGSKVFKLKPGTYDILIEYTDSPEKRIPSKLLKGVEVLETTKVEQTINFDLGQITLVSIDNQNNLVPAHYRINKAGTSTTVAEIETGAQRDTFFISPGSYDIAAQQLGAVKDRLTLSEKGVEIKPGAIAERTFLFQKGTLAVRGETTQKQTLPFVYQLYAAGRSDALIASGAFTAQGGKINLSPGMYDLIATGQDPSLPADPRTKVTNIPIRAGQPTELVIKFEMGEITLNAVNQNGEAIPAEFHILEKESGMEIAKVMSDGKQPARIPIPPGVYSVKAYSSKATTEPKPLVTIDRVEVTAEKPASTKAKFVLGTLRVRGANSKEESVRTQFTLYQGGTEEVISTSKPTSDWVLFEVSPGAYDLKATDMTATSPDKPYVLLKDLDVEAGKTISHQAIFTQGKIKIIGRGPNNKIIPVRFKIFEYGADRELINGKTGDDWARFEIPPGRYYLEAAYVDPEQDVLLKKWVNVNIGENEVVEQVLRF